MGTEIGIHFPSCVCLNKIYILLSFLFPFFSFMSPLSYCTSKLPGRDQLTNTPFPSAVLKIWGPFGQEAREGRQGPWSWETGLGAQACCRLSVLSLALWLLSGADLESADLLFARIPSFLLLPVTPTTQTSGAAQEHPGHTYPRGPSLLPFPIGPRGARRSEVRGSTQVQFLGGTASLMRQREGCPR